MDYRELLDPLRLMPPAEEASIARLRLAVGRELPPAYVELLRVANGAEGFIGKNYLAIYASEAVSEDPFPHADFVPGLLFFASDGGEALFAFDLRERSDRVLVVHGDDLEPSHVVELSPSLPDFLRLLHERDWIDVWHERYKNTY
jgi:hypothetical protein